MPGTKHLCDNCGRITPEAEQMYSIRIQLFARVDPLVFTDEDIAQASEGALAKIIDTMEHLDAEEAQDQVFECYTFDLCSRCRGVIHRQLKDRVRASDQ